jgi:hypothetical protein
VQASKVVAAGTVADVTVGADKVVGGVLAGGVQAEPAQCGAVGGRSIRGYQRRQDAEQLLSTRLWCFRHLRSILHLVIVTQPSDRGLGLVLRVVADT